MPKARGTGLGGRTRTGSVVKEGHSVVVKGGVQAHQSPELREWQKWRSGRSASARGRVASSGVVARQVPAAALKAHVLPKRFSGQVFCITGPGNVQWG